MMMVSIGLGSSRGEASASFSQDNLGPEKVFTAEPIALETPNATLYGTLELPQSRSKMPVVLIIAGSGPTDRDGNSPALPGANNSLKLLAEALAARGIASVRYDKRGVGETGKAMLAAVAKTKTILREEDLSFENYIDDAVRWGKQLRADRRFSALTVLGHSEGSLIGMVAAQRISADAFISVAGAGRPIRQIILEQVTAQMSPELLKKTEEILEQLSAGKQVAAPPSELNALFRPSIQPYMISWLRYEPGKEIGKLRIPILIVQGTTDLQTRLEDSTSLANSNPAAKLLLIEGMNHVLKTVPNDRDRQVSSYSDPTLPVTPALIIALTEFVDKGKCDECGRGRTTSSHPTSRQSKRNPTRWIASKFSSSANSSLISERRKVGVEQLEVALTCIQPSSLVNERQADSAPVE
jgi:pimeloyl-ACP methyl ester carboxylesterase